MMDDEEMTIANVALVLQQVPDLRVHKILTQYIDVSKWTLQYIDGHSMKKI